MIGVTLAAAIAVACGWSAPRILLPRWFDPLFDLLVLGGETWPMGPTSLSRLASATSPCQSMACPALSHRSTRLPPPCPTTRSAKSPQKPLSAPPKVCVDVFLTSSAILSSSNSSESIAISLTTGSPRAATPSHRPKAFAPWIRCPLSIWKGPSLDTRSRGGCLSSWGLGSSIQPSLCRLRRG